MYGKGISISLAHDIATERVVIMPDAELSQECGGKIGLITDLFDAPWLFHSTTQPEHGHMVVLGVVFLHAQIGESMIGEEDYQQVFP